MPQFLLLKHGWSKPEVPRKLSCTSKPRPGTRVFLHLQIQPQEPFPLLQELTVWSKPHSCGLASPPVPLGGKDIPEAAAGVCGVFREQRATLHPGSQRCSQRLGSEPLFPFLCRSALSPIGPTPVVTPPLSVRQVLFPGPTWCPSWRRRMELMQNCWYTLSLSLTRYGTETRCQLWTLGPRSPTSTSALTSCIHLPDSGSTPGPGLLL